MKTTVSYAAIILIAGVWLCGCGQMNFPAALGLTLDELEQIRDDTDLTAQEKRDKLAELGIDDVLANGILRNERLGNQFGGTLSSAWQKVKDGQLSTMTPDEVQLYGDAATVVFSDDAAQSAVNLFRGANINTSDALAAYLDDPANELDPDLDEANLRTAFIDTSPDDLIDLLP